MPVWMKKMGVALLVAACSVATAAGKDDDFEEPTRLVHALQPEVAKAGSSGVSAEAQAKLRAARKAILDYTRQHADGPLDNGKWGIPFGYCYDWCLEYELKTHAEAQAAVGEAFDVLKQVGPEYSTLAAEAAGSVVWLYAEKWMVSNAPECVRLLDEVEAWALKQPGAKKDWYWLVRYTQANFLLQEHQFGPVEREWLWRSRQERLKAYETEDVLGFESRTLTVMHWSNVLYRTGRGQEAERLLIGWWTRYGDKVRDAEFFQSLLRVLLFEKGDWEAAGQVLEHANMLRDQWRGPSEQRAYEALARLYYDNLSLADYELRRKRGMELKEIRHRLEKGGADARVTH